MYVYMYSGSSLIRSLHRVGLSPSTRVFIIPPYSRFGKVRYLHLKIDTQSVTHLHLSMRGCCRGAARPRRVCRFNGPAGQPGRPRVKVGGPGS